jgi:hypothetical protein
MSFAGLLGAGLLGGVANAAKGVGDKLREEAKQKRAMALVDQAQANAVALQEEVAEDNIEQARQEGKITIAVDDNTSGNTIAEADNAAGNASDLLAQRGDIDAAAAVVTQANNITNLNAQGDIAKSLAELNALLKDTTDVKQADLLAAQTKLQAAIDKAAAKTKAEVDTETVKVATTTAQDVAEKLAGTQMDMAVYDTATNKDVAAALVAAQTKTAAKLGETRMAELNANNVAALAQINAGKVGDVHSFYDETTGMEYKAVRNKDGGWDQQGGVKASTASKNAYTLQDIQINGVNVRGYMNGTDFVVVGNPIPDGKKTDWDEKQVTDYATAQGWKRVGVAVNIWGRPIGKDISADDKAQVTKWTADVVTQWNKTGTSPATLVNDILGGKKTGLTGGSTGGATNEAADLVKAQNAINNGAPFNAVVQSLKQTYPNIDTSGLKKK